MSDDSDGSSSDEYRCSNEYSAVPYEHKPKRARHKTGQYNEDEDDTDYLDSSKYLKKNTCKFIVASDFINKITPCILTVYVLLCEAYTTSKDSNPGEKIDFIKVGSSSDLVQRLMQHSVNYYRVKVLCVYTPIRETDIYLHRHLRETMGSYTMNDRLVDSKNTKCNHELYQNDEMIFTKIDEYAKRNKWKYMYNYRDEDEFVKHTYKEMINSSNYFTL